MADAGAMAAHRRIHANLHEGEGLQNPFSKMKGMQGKVFKKYWEMADSHPLSVAAVTMGVALLAISFLALGISMPTGIIVLGGISLGLGYGAHKALTKWDPNNLPEDWTPRRVAFTKGLLKVSKVAMRPLITLGAAIVGTYVIGMFVGAGGGAAASHAADATVTKAVAAGGIAAAHGVALSVGLLITGGGYLFHRKLMKKEEAERTTAHKVGIWAARALMLAGVITAVGGLIGIIKGASALGHMTPAAKKITTIAIAGMAGGIGFFAHEKLNKGDPASHTRTRKIAIMAAKFFMFGGLAIAAIPAIQLLMSPISFLMGKVTLMEGHWELLIPVVILALGGRIGQRGLVARVKDPAKRKKVAANLDKIGRVAMFALFMGTAGAFMMGGLASPTFWNGALVAAVGMTAYLPKLTKANGAALMPNAGARKAKKKREGEI